MHLNIVPPRTGLLWVRLGIQSFFRQPLALTGLFFLSTAAMKLVSMLPLVGGALTALLLPAASLGLMLATKDASEGRFPMPAVLITGFRSGRGEARDMLILGLICAASFTLMGAIADLFGRGAQTLAVPADGNMTPEVLLQVLLHPANLVYTLLSIPLSLMFWHAPALVHWHGQPPLKSLFFSLVACGRNFLALSVLGLGWFGVLVLVYIPVTLLGMMAGNFSFMTSLVVTVTVLISAMMYASVYFTFRDSFQAAPGENP